MASQKIWLKIENCFGLRESKVYLRNERTFTAGMFLDDKSKQYLLNLLKYVVRGPIVCAEEITGKMIECLTVLTSFNWFFVTK